MKNAYTAKIMILPYVKHVLLDMNCIKDRVKNL